MTIRALVPLCLCLTVGSGNISDESETIRDWDKTYVQYCNNPNLLVSVECKNASLADILDIVLLKYGGLMYSENSTLKYPSKITLSVKNVTLGCLLYIALQLEKTKKVRLLAPKLLQWSYFTNLGLDPGQYSFKGEKYVSNEALSLIF